ncbi:hypothetical protein V6N11_008534 [Hibiscus sabdariffa]|uniref:Uncharacterized protein n=1 Tax=Hibiscus sabdariffa TaxID=183260 RepID=A0ABR2PP94_9ROSI
MFTLCFCCQETRETDLGGPNEVLEASGRSLAWGRQEGKEDQGITFVQVRFCGYGSMYKQWGGLVLDGFWMVFGEIAAQIRAFLVSSTGTSLVVSVPIPLWNPCTGTAILVSVLFVIGIGTYILVPVRIGFSIGTIIGVPVRSDTGIGTSFRVPVLAA